jgi:hypothetical protein
METDSSSFSNSPKNLNSFDIKENSIDYSISTSITYDSESPLLLAKEIKNQKKGFDVAVIALPGIISKDFQEISQTLKSVLKKIKILNYDK